MKKMLSVSFSATALALCLSANTFAHEDHDHAPAKKVKNTYESPATTTPAPKASSAPEKKHNHSDGGHSHDHNESHDHGHDHGHDHDHSHGHAAPRVITDQQALAVSIGASKRLTTHDAGLPFGLLPESWGKLSQDNASISSKGNGYYIVSVKNDAEKKTLFLLIGTNGNVYDANFTGEFKGLKQNEFSIALNLSRIQKH